MKYYDIMKYYNEILYYCKAHKILYNITIITADVDDRNLVLRLEAAFEALVLCDLF